MNATFHKRFLMLLCILSVTLVSCSQESDPHRSTYSNDVGFQYDLPSDFCRTPPPESYVLELYCAEGKITIDILEKQSNQQPNEVISQALSDLDVKLDSYQISTERSKVDLEGNYRSVQLAKLINIDNEILNHNRYPRYIAFSSFGSDKIFVAKGYLYNVHFDLRFSDIFWTVVESFEPFSPP